MVVNIAADVPGFTSNAFFVDGESTVLVDTGANFDAVATLERADVTLDAIVLTHTHPDHVGNLDAITNAFDVPVYAYDASISSVGNPIDDGDVLVLGDYEYRAYHTPGHKADHVCFYAEGVGILFSGDLIFEGGGIGRTDLPGGDPTALRESIERIASITASDLRTIYPGHGPTITEDAYRHVELARAHTTAF